MRTYSFITTAFVFSCILHCSLTAQSFEELKDNFIIGYSNLRLPGYTYDYRNYFSTIPSRDIINEQKEFFKQAERNLLSVNKENLSAKQQLYFKTIAYEVQFNLQRLQLEEEWVNEGRKIPAGGLYTLSHHKQWYQYFIHKFTSTAISPAQVFEMGKAEVARVKKEISRLQNQLGYHDETVFYTHLNDPVFFLTDKTTVVNRFSNIDSTVRKNLSAFVGHVSTPSVYAMEWPGAGPSTPPGIYLHHSDNAFGKDVFQFNFYGGHYNYRVMEWIYMHEGIPGHHLQASLRKADPLLDLFVYPGNFEGWACYVEYYGKELGLFTDAYMELGKWEWDLVRSLRLVLDAGIHYYGWTKQQALQYWKENIKGQDDIAEREVSRVTNWAAQALSYKIGASFIFQLQENWRLKNPAGQLKDFRLQYLSAGMVPLLIMQDII
ncbi:MAG: DUF885 domain-containing protein [Bacteroidota bacterium]